MHFPVLTNTIVMGEYWHKHLKKYIQWFYTPAALRLYSASFSKREQKYVFVIYIIFDPVVQVSLSFI